MNDFNTQNVTANSINGLVGSYVIAKLKSGRAISGTLAQDSKGDFTIKLGVKHIPLALDTLARVTLLP